MPDGNAAAQRVLGIGKLLKECNYSVRFCGLSRNISIPEKGEFDGFEYINYPYPTSFKSWYKYLTGRDNSIKEILNYKPDILIVYNHPALAIEHLTKFCHLHGIKIIADVTEWYKPAGNLIFRTIKEADTTRRMTKSHKQLDGLICISNFLTEYYKKNYIPIINIPPLVDIKQSKWQYTPIKDSNVVKILYAGSPGSKKDRLDLIIKALDEVLPKVKNQVKFDIIGITQEQYQTNWNDKKDYPFITFHGRIEHNEVIKYLSNADFQIFLRPNTLPNRAGFPTKFVETITSSTLPITNLSSNLSEYLIDNTNGFIITSLELSSIKESLIKALNLSYDNLIKMKSHIKSDTFDYHKYITTFKNFLSSI